MWSESKESRRGKRLPARRTVLAGLTGALLLPASAALARLPATPSQSEGPFYPTDSVRPNDTDADLVHLDGAAERAAGEIVHVDGRVLDRDGKPVPRALVEIWQANAEGVYNHPSDGNDPNFQGYGAVATNAEGRYGFRTIKPGAYGSIFFRRTPHIHFKIRPTGGRPLTTQMYFEGDELNGQDGILRSLDEAERKRVIVPFRPSPTREANSRAGFFEIVLG